MPINFAMATLSCSLLVAFIIEYVYQAKSLLNPIIYRSFALFLNEFLDIKNELSTKEGNMSANSTAAISSTLESTFSSPEPPLVEFQQHIINITTNNENSSEGSAIIPGFPVDECFEQQLDRRLSLDIDANGNTNVAMNGSYKNYEEGGLYTFEEFIKAPGSASSRSRVLADKGNVIAQTDNHREADWKKVVDEFNASLDDSDRSCQKKEKDDGFFKIALESAQSNRFLLARPSTAKRSALYMMKAQKNSSTQQCQASTSSTVCLRQTFCPTVSARSDSSMTSSSYGGTSGTAQAAASSVASTCAYEQANSSSLYGNQLPSDEPRTIQADAFLTDQNHFNMFYGDMHSSNNGRCLITDPSTVVSSSFGEDGVVLGIAHPLQQQLIRTGRQAGRNSTYEEDMTVYTAAEQPETVNRSNPNSDAFYNRSTYTGLFVAKLMCCFSRGDAQRRRDDHYRKANAPFNGMVNFSQPEKYSWDIERPDPKNFTFADAADEVLIKGPGKVNGQQFAIENCIDCILIVLDHSSTIMIDDCKNCIIMLGPCKGSVFMRDCSNCVIYAICQQFRSRDCQDIEARLFCTTAPTIEESNHVEFSPLWMSYEGIEKHISSAGLSPFTNRWCQVHNFTPESAKFTITTVYSSATIPSHVVVSFQINDKFQLLVVQSPNGLTLLPDESFFFYMSLEKQLRAYEERALILVKSFDKHSILKTPEQLYYETRQLIRDLFRHANQPLNTLSRTATIRLLDIKDIDLRPGELETVLQLKFNSKSCGGKLIVIEVAGAAAKHLCSQVISSSIVAEKASTKHCYQLVELVADASTDFYRTQLYRLSEIQSSV